MYNCLEWKINTAAYWENRLMFSKQCWRVIILARFQGERHALKGIALRARVCREKKTYKYVHKGKERGIFRVSQINEEHANLGT